MTSMGVRDRIGAGADVPAALADLAPDEVRILVISAAGRADLDTLAAQLGLPRTDVAERRARLRRKLGVPPFEALGDFVARTPQLAAVLGFPEDRPAAPPAPRGTGPERRSKHVLRVGIDEVRSLAGRLAAQSAALRAFLPAAPAAEGALLAEEAAHLSALAEELSLVASRATSAARRPS